MTFPERLERLRDTALADKSSWYDMDQFLRNHADAILGLVRAAEEIHAERDELGRTLCCETLIGHHQRCDLNNALAKLNGGHK